MLTITPETVGKRGGKRRVAGQRPRHRVKTKRIKKIRSVYIVKLYSFYDKIKPKYCDVSLLLAVVVLGVLGIFFVYSASKYNATVYYDNDFYYTGKQIIGLFLGLIGLTVMYFVDYRALQKYAYIIYIVAVVLLACVFIPGIGVAKLGANRWIGVGGFSIQPSEIAKFAFVIFSAKIFATRKHDQYNRHDTHARPDTPTFTNAAPHAPTPTQTFIANHITTQKYTLIADKYNRPDTPTFTDTNVRHATTTITDTHDRPDTPTLKQTLLVILAGGIICLLIILEPNMSITMCVGIILFLMLFLCGVRMKTLAFIIAPAIIVVALMLIAEPYRLKRLSALVDPWATPKEEGFQLIQSLYAIGNGGFFGVGYGNSTQKFMFLPFSESDFIFSIIAEEFGLIGCILLFSLYAYIIYKIFAAGWRCADYFGRYLCYGIATIILTQSALNFAVATGCIPPTGLPLPFVSFGGTSILVFMSAIGVVLNIDKNNKKKRETLIMH
ncbi:MAG: putative lipid II flippase FtsW [Christensenellaceae bacterium]|jgi:cell division protein FtsW (lipid II flippase)|nr:putative lipid II flippase FtsW [Christensenellaceae bacterium]